MNTVPTEPGLVLIMQISVCPNSDVGFPHFHLTPLDSGSLKKHIEEGVNNIKEYQCHEDQPVINKICSCFFFFFQHII